MGGSRGKIKKVPGDRVCKREPAGKSPLFSALALMNSFVLLHAVSSYCHQPEWDWPRPDQRKKKVTKPNEIHLPVATAAIHWNVLERRLLVINQSSEVMNY